MNLEKEKEKAFILKRAKAAVISRDFALAARLYKNLLKNDPGSIALLSALGSLYVKSGDDKKALLYYEQMRTLSPDNFEALNSMGGIYRRLQRYDESINVLQQALGLGLDDAQVNYNLGFTYRSMGAYDEATECFESVIDENPGDVLAYNHLGVIYALRKEYQKAVSVYKRGLQVDPNHPILQLNLAKSYEALHDDSEAASAYEAALRAKPGWLEAVRNYTELLLRHHKTKEAADLVKKSIILYPDDIGIQNLLGHIYLKQYDYASAVQTFEKAGKLDGANLNVLRGLAEAFEKSDEVKSAEEVIKKAEELQPEDTAVTRQYAHILLSADNTESAAAKIKKAYDKSKNDVQTLDLYGQYYICRNEDDKADLVYNKINKLDASYEEYKKEAAGRYKQKGRLDKARRYLEQYLEKHPQDPAGLIALARLEEAAGNTAAALEDYHKVLKYDRYNVLARGEAQRLGDIINETNRRTQEKNKTFNDENSGLEIVMDTPEEEISDSTPAEDQNQEPEEEPFDFDAMGDSLLKEDDEQDPFAFSDKEDDENESDEKQEGLDQLIPADQPIDQSEKENDVPDILDGTPESSDSADPSVPGSVDDGFGMENIEEEPARQVLQPAVSPFVQPEQPQNYGNVPEQQPYAGSGAEKNDPYRTAGDSSPDSSSDMKSPETTRTSGSGEPEKYEEPTEPQHEPVLSDSGLDEIAAAPDGANESGDPALASARRTYDAAQRAAERAWNAAQMAADSAQGADNAVEYINSKTEEAAMKAAEAAIQKIQEAAEKASGELAENQMEQVSEACPCTDVPAPPEETQSADDGGLNAGTGERTEESDDYDAMIDEAAGVLPDIVAMLEKRENAEKFTTELELFRKLRALCEYLPLDKKEAFMSSRTRLLLDYVIAKLSGRPGLIATAGELRKTGLLSGLFPPDDDMAACSGMPDKELARTVIENMRVMVQDLPDAYLAKALDDCAVEALGTL